MLGKHGPAKEKALSLVAATRFQESPLLRRFDAFGHNLLLGAYAHCNNGADDSLAAIAVNIVHERLVDLERVDRETPQVAQE